MLFCHLVPIRLRKISLGRDTKNRFWYSQCIEIVIYVLKIYYQTFHINISSRAGEIIIRSSSRWSGLPAPGVKFDIIMMILKLTQYFFVFQTHLFIFLLNAAPLAPFFQIGWVSAKSRPKRALIGEAHPAWRTHEANEIIDFAFSTVWDWMS